MKRTFIVLGDSRIKLSNIKQYGITEEPVESIEEVDLTMSGLIDTIFNGGTITTRGKQKARVKSLMKVLYVTTYQGDNHRFRKDEASFDIEQKLTELDNYLA